MKIFNFFESFKSFSYLNFLISILTIILIGLISPFIYFILILIFIILLSNNKIFALFIENFEKILVIILLIILSLIFADILNIKILNSFWKKLNNKYLFIGFYSISVLLMWSTRNKQLNKQSEIQFKIFQGTKEFDNFLEATKLLTDKDSTIQAKISAIYLFYDIANKHSDNLDRVIQILNKELTPLIKCLENDCNTNAIKKILKKEKQVNTSLQRIKKYEIEHIDIININYFEKDIKKIIKEWEYKGNNTEKLITVILKVLKKIVIDFVLYKDKQIELSNTILFDIDTEFDKNLKFRTTKRPVENLIFLNCNLENVDFKAVKYYFAKFINCNLNESNFSNSNLWGTDFINCNLKNVKFNKAECEGVTFYNSELTKEQIKSMKFKFKNKVNEIKKELCNCCDKNICGDNFYPIFYGFNEKEFRKKEFEKLKKEKIKLFEIEELDNKKIEKIYKEFLKNKYELLYKNNKR